MLTVSCMACVTLVTYDKMDINSEYPVALMILIQELSGLLKSPFPTYYEFASCKDGVFPQLQ